LQKFLLKIFIIATTAVTLPVMEFSIDFSLALIISKAVLVALIGGVSLDVKLVLGGLFNLRRSSTCSLGLLYPLSYLLSELSLDESCARFLEDFLDLDFLSFFLIFELLKFLGQISHLSRVTTTLFPGLLCGIEGLMRLAYLFAVLVEPTTIAGIMGLIEPIHHLAMLAVLGSACLLGGWSS
jgi:hypothetical protein